MKVVMIERAHQMIGLNKALVLIAMLADGTGFAIPGELVQPADLADVTKFAIDDTEQDGGTIGDAGGTVDTSLFVGAAQFAAYQNAVSVVAGKLIAQQMAIGTKLNELCSALGHAPLALDTIENAAPAPDAAPATSTEQIPAGFVKLS